MSNKAARSSDRTTVERWLRRLPGDAISPHDIERLLLDLVLVASPPCAEAFERSARALFQAKGGAPEKDDRRLLAQVDAKVARGKDPWAACTYVARAASDDAEWLSLTHRLYRKFRKKELTKPVL